MAAFFMRTDKMIPKRLATAQLGDHHVKESNKKTPPSSPEE